MPVLVIPPDMAGTACGYCNDACGKRVDQTQLETPETWEAGWPHHPVDLRTNPREAVASLHLFVMLAHLPATTQKWPFGSLKNA